ncbi:hypothetical protein N7E81_17620 [Reichenbachiella carrageenanivorans]|uniref:Addiction module component n=1 Tax=Reichenbachiella carrageenanivorans TaxID=2979869 RepID=A0ABY6D5P7_9BACT|nr:hypothetical protein [Reichenbachiella carrageenanivorans]UXX79175.1 hypothetical protein N7E81_17620 [Reichenbachiella carrageenanivorans]
MNLFENPITKVLYENWCEKINERFPELEFSNNNILSLIDHSQTLSSNSKFFVYLNMATVGTKYRITLIERIKSIQDRDILDEVNRLLEVDIDDTIYNTTKEQKQEIEQARIQLANGQGVSSEQADREIEEWLSK